MGVYPDYFMIKRTVEIGGASKSQLDERLHQHAVKLNAYAEHLLADERFTTSEKKYSIQTVEVTVRDLGFPEGATFPQIFERASELGLAL